jgi:hypothetical protein
MCMACYCSSKALHYTIDEDGVYSREKRKDTGSVVVLTLIYVCIFISGTVGNMSTCVVIARNPYMHTVTNYYLFSLAISDLLILLTIGDL